MTDHNELVRCGECKFWSETEKGVGRCLKSGFETPKDFLGEDGEGKDHGMTDYTKLVEALRCKRDDCEGCELAFFDKDEWWMCQYAAKDDDAADAIEALQAAEPTEKQVVDYCHKRCFVVLEADLFHELKASYGKTPKRGEIVRCGECAHCYAEGFAHERNICEKHPELGNVPDDWFCADGEREVQE